LTLGATGRQQRAERDTRIASAKSGEINQERVAAEAAKHVTDSSRDKQALDKETKGRSCPHAPAFRTLHCDHYLCDHLRGRGAATRRRREGIGRTSESYSTVREKNPVHRQTKGSTDNEYLCERWEQKWKNKQIKRLKCQQRRRRRIRKKSCKRYLRTFV
jgi:hypothetical protein